MNMLQQPPQLVHHIPLMLHEGVGVAIQSHGRVFVAEDLGERLHVHAALEGARRKRMPQGMKALMRDTQSF